MAPFRCRVTRHYREFIGRRCGFRVALHRRRHLIHRRHGLLHILDRLAGAIVEIFIALRQSVAAIAHTYHLAGNIIDQPAAHQPQLSDRAQGQPQLVAAVQMVNAVTLAGRHFERLTRHILYRAHDLLLEQESAQQHHQRARAQCRPARMSGNKRGSQCHKQTSHHTTYPPAQRHCR
ncbi:hypothetical protein D3C72_754960 [compost metagenome]